MIGSKQLTAHLKRAGAENVSDDLLRQAFRHKSCVPSDPAKSNERLEFLGDAVLGLVVAEDLFRRFPDLREGDLARARSMVVSGATLSALARRLCLGPHVLLGASETVHRARSEDSLSADVVEAIIGCVFVEIGFESARRLVLSILSLELGSVGTGSDLRDPKTELQEIQQSKGSNVPVYTLTAETGPIHARTFTYAVMLDGTTLGQGSGSTKKAAQIAAAREALLAIKLNTVETATDNKRTFK